jgi:endonuclease YncB( thermonuclease family)
MYVKLEDFTAHLYHYKAEVIERGDGDSFRVMLALGDDVYKKRNIRVFGLKCPETRTRDLEEKRRGLESAGFTASLIPIGSTVYLKSYKDAKSADRLVCEVFFIQDVGGDLQNLGAAVVNNGYGEWDSRWVKVSTYAVRYS